MPMDFTGGMIFIRILLPAIAGTWIGLSLPASGFIVAVFLTVCLFLFIMLIACHCWYRRLKLYLHRWLPGLIVQVLVVFVFSSIALSRNPLLRDDHFSKNKADVLIAEISSEPNLSNKIWRFEVSVRQGLREDCFVPLSGKMLITVYADTSGRNYGNGDYLLLPYDFSETQVSLNPFEFNYKQYLANKGIFHQAFFYSNRLKTLNISAKKSLGCLVLTLRQRMVWKFKQYINNEDAAAIGSTLILGYKASLSEEILNAYSRTGVMHVLSVSGMHVAMLLVMLTCILWFLRQRKGLRVLQSLLIILIIWFYSFLTGFSAAVCRAALMISFVIIGRAFNRDNNSTNSVAASAVILLVYNPCFLKDIGFQLSFLAVFGLIYLYPMVYKLVVIQNWIGDKLWSFTAISLSAQIFTFPLCMYYFNQFPLYFLISNLFIVLPVTLVMYAGIAFMLIPFEPLSKVLGWILEKTIVFINEGLFLIERFPYSAIHSQRFGFWYYASIYLIIALLIFSFQYKRKLFFYGSLLVVFLLTSVSSLQSLRQEQKKSIMFFSVRKNIAVGFFNGRKGDIVTGLNRNSKAFTYSVSPLIDARNLRINNCYPITAGFNNNCLFSDGHFYQFLGCRLLIWDRTFNFKCYKRKAVVQHLLLSGNPVIDIKSLRQYVQFDSLIIGGDNSDYRVRKWTREAGVLGIKYYVLKNAPAIELSL
ncbi:DUF4131 domain-containing protein [Arcticibacter tournemirensis]|uniref:DUF4131 domain-containing protein n=2 Tax=Arcticibacter tournemirensis TaxID=699437 RepID=A0A5M9HI13_9SPHI|nr:DUF4131 domain-containing protein [Arcticibacter tournemirensis]